MKVEPALLANVRELRDRWMERVNAGAAGAAEPFAIAGKYDVSRALRALPRKPTPLLPAA